MPATMLDLPLELLMLITSNFDILKARKPVTQYPRPGDQVLESTPSDRQSLLALSATCRYLRDILQGLLYDVAYPDTAEVQFARSLKDRPDLAARVRELYYSSNAHENRQHRPLYTKPINKYALYPSKIPGKGNFNELAAQHPQGLDDEDLWEDEDGEICGEDHLGLWSHLYTGYREECESKQRVLDRNLLVQTLRMIPKVERLALWYEPYDIKQLPSGILPRLRHLTIFGPDLWWSPDSYTIDGFSEAMANLQILDCHFTRELITESSSTITELNFNCCVLSRESFNKIAVGFTKLRKLSYHISPTASRGGTVVSARGVCEALHPRRDTLRDLSIWMDGFFSKTTISLHPEPIPAASDDDTLMPSLADNDHTEDPCSLPQLTRLERLSLNADAVFDLQMSMPAGTPIESLLPPTLRHMELCLAGLDSSYGVRPYLDWMGARTDRCPDLDLVKICHHLPEPEPEIAELFRGLGATYSCQEACDRDEDKLAIAHMMIPAESRDYDNYPRWRFWDPEVGPMPCIDRQRT